MKKMLMLLLCLMGVSSVARADVLGDQITAALTDHATFAIEYRQGSKNLILSDNVIEIGKLKNDYVSSIDLGLNGATLPGSTQGTVQFTTGLRLNLHALVKGLVVFKPEWTFLNHFEYYGRGYYNWTEKVWRGSLNLGYGFGPGAGK